MNSRTIFAAVGLAAAGAVLAAPTASAGLIDGTLNNAHVLDHVSQLDTLVNGTAQTVLENTGDAAGLIME
jgi:hypothetical protein